MHYVKMCNIEDISCPRGDTNQIPTKGVVTLPCECKGNTFQVNFHVVEMEAPTVLEK